MFELDEKSLKNLNTCHPDIQTIFNELIKKTNFIIVTGFIDETTQNKAFGLGVTKLAWPEGKHNKIPSMSLDAYPANICLHPKDITEKNIYIVAMRHFAAKVFAEAETLKLAGKITHEIIWGAGWEDSNEYSFLDYAHFELA